MNPPDAAACASRKLVQQKAAVEAGFTTPDTLYTNDPEEIRGFLRHHGGEIEKIFRANDIAREALVAVQLFVDAAEREAVTAQLAHTVAERLKEARLPVR